jgi:hypothetical protein
MAARKHLMDNVKKTVKGVSDNLHALLYCGNISMLLTWNANNNSEPNLG